MKKILAGITALLFLGPGLTGCSKEAEVEQEEKKQTGAIEKMTDAAAEKAVKKIRTPMDKARAAKQLEQDREGAIDEALSNQ